MKKLIGILSLITLFAWSPERVGAQRVSLTKTAETANKAAEAVEFLEGDISYLIAENDSLEQRLENIAADVAAVVEQGKEDVKIPTDVVEAKSLYAFFSSLVTFIIVGLFNKDKLPKWLNKFTISIGVGGIITALAYFGSGGEFTVAEAVEFFFFVIGGSNAIHQVTKEKKPKPA